MDSKEAFFSCYAIDYYQRIILSVNLFSAGTVFRRQDLTSDSDVWRRSLFCSHIQNEVLSTVAWQMQTQLRVEVKNILGVNTLTISDMPIFKVKYCILHEKMWTTHHSARLHGNSEGNDTTHGNNHALSQLNILHLFIILIHCPANTTHLDVWPMLDTRRRRWANIGQTLAKCVMFVGYEVGIVVAIYSGRSIETDYHENLGFDGELNLRWIM